MVLAWTLGFKEARAGNIGGGKRRIFNLGGIDRPPGVENGDVLLKH